MAKILIIEKDQTTINALVHLARDIRLDAVVVHTWPTHSREAVVQEMDLVFVNVEMTAVELDQLYADFPQNGSSSAGLVFLFSRTFDPKYVQAKKQPHAGDLKKPLSLIDTLAYIEEYIKLETMPDRLTDYGERLSKFKAFHEETEDWISKLSTILGKQATGA